MARRRVDFEVLSPQQAKSYIDYYRLQLQLTAPLIAGILILTAILSEHSHEQKLYGFLATYFMIIAAQSMSRYIAACAPYEELTRDSAVSLPSDNSSIIAAIAAVNAHPNDEQPGQVLLVNSNSANEKAKHYEVLCNYYSAAGFAIITNQNYLSWLLISVISGIVGTATDHSENYFLATLSGAIGLLALLAKVVFQTRVSIGDSIFQKPDAELFPPGDDAAESFYSLQQIDRFKVYEQESGFGSAIKGVWHSLRGPLSMLGCRPI